MLSQKLKQKPESVQNPNFCVTQFLWCHCLYKCCRFKQHRCSVSNSLSVSNNPSSCFAALKSRRLFKFKTRLVLCVAHTSFRTIYHVLFFFINGLHTSEPKQSSRPKQSMRGRKTNCISTRMLFFDVRCSRNKHKSFKNVD